MKLDDPTLRRLASVDLFRPEKARVLLDNDEAFATKLAMVESARSSIDMIFYAYRDDYTSSAFSEAVLAAVGRGVDVRLLVDYAKNYPRLDLFSMLEDAADDGPGSFETRFYNRPTHRILEDAAFMTTGRSTDGEAPPGLFLSGWYSGRADVMALAVRRGRALDLETLTAAAEGAGAASGERLESLKELALTYWRSRSGTRFRRVANRLKLSLALWLYGSKIEQLKESVSSFLPLRASGKDRDWRDWEHLTDYLHQKLLLVDDDQVMLGGRNLGDSYHLSAGNALLGDQEYFFDTDLYAELPATGGVELRRAFDRLWTFETMVAGIADVRRHAPNDFVANRSAFEQAEEECAQVHEDARRECVDRAFEAAALSLEQRIAARHRQMAENAERYRRTCAPEKPPRIASPSFEIDAGARLAYFENLPFDRELAAAERVRLYGARGLEEVRSGKYLTRLWRDGLIAACDRATAESPQRVVFVNAYYLPPANLLHAAARMADGSLDCRHVQVQVLTNSAATSNFKIINLIADHGLKAFSDFYRRHDAAERATFEFYEYRPLAQVENFCLHSKVTVLGEDVFVGSANVDVRSYMMDANNGVLIRGAGAFRESYLAFVDAEIADTGRVENAGERVRSAPREAMKEEHLQAFRELVEAFDLDTRLDQDQHEVFEEVFLEVLDEVYELTYGVLEGRDGAIDNYNRLFQLL